MYSYQKIYIDLIQKHLNRKLREDDGYTDTEITELENRLDLKLPQSMRDLYQVAGNIYNDLMGFIYLVNPSNIQDTVSDDLLVFMEESQYITVVGVKVSELTNSDPEVWIIDNAYGEIQISTKVSFSEFIVRLVDDETFMENIMENISELGNQLEEN